MLEQLLGPITSRKPPNIGEATQHGIDIPRRQALLQITLTVPKVVSYDLENLLARVQPCLHEQREYGFVGQRPAPLESFGGRDLHRFRYAQHCAAPEFVVGCAERR